jgi:hypothetical protein
MNFHVNIKYLVAIAAFFFFFISVNAKKRALIVAVAQYPENSGWKKINSDNDVEIIKQGLFKQEFQKEDIKVLLNEQATKIAIINEFDNLTRSIRSGDIIYFHFSGHGQQVTDINGDELDSYDEALVPYNTPQKNLINEKTAGKHIIDDELNKLILELRKKCGKSGDVLVAIDACHSGTIYRGDKENDENEIFRGTDQKYILDIASTVGPNISRKYNYADYQENPEKSETLSPFLLISACAAEQSNREFLDRETNKRYGVLSYVISALFSQNINDMTYISFFESLKMKMASLDNYYIVKQAPQMEGITDREVFAGKTVVIPNHFTIEKLSAKENMVVINGGSLAGIKPGTEISFFPPDTYNVNKSKPIQKATVTNAGLTECILKYSSPCNIDTKSWAIVSKYTFPDGTEKESRAGILREAKSDTKDITLEILPFFNGKNQNIETKKRNGNIEFYYDDQFDVVITNNSNNPLYFQLINVLPDNEIKLLRFGLTPNDFRVEPQQTKLFPLRINQNAPVGLETLVLVASKDILNLSAIETQKPNRERDGMNEFENFINDLYSGERSFYYSFGNINADSKNYYVRSK